MEEKEYFLWVPYEGAEHKEKINITDFCMNPLEKSLDRKILRGVDVSGLIKITMNGDSGEANNAEDYNIKFKGRMKINLSLSEEEKIRMKNRRESSRNWMRRNREGNPEENIKIQIADDFPKEELSKKLNGVPYYIEEVKLKDLVYDILYKKEILTPKQLLGIYKNPLWIDAITDFMRTKEDFKKEGNKYVRIQK